MHRLSTSVAFAAIISIAGPATLTAVLAQEAVGQPPLPRPADAETDRLQDIIAAQEPLFEPLEGDAAGAAPDPITAEELDDLVAPIALYPDALLAQILVAATYPLQIVKADRLLEDSAGMTDDELGAAIADEAWDPSVLVLMSGFPSVIRRMADDLDGTEALGEAILAQDDDVLDAVQRMRADAVAAGTLTTNDAQVVEQEDDRVAIRPADPEVIYVPQYDPATAYAFPPATRSAPQSVTPPVTGSGSVLGALSNPLVAGGLAFGTALLVDQVFGDDDGGNGNGDDWNGYWKRARPIDWTDREFHPRPRAPGTSWSTERDRYWDRTARRWRRDTARDQARAEERRAAIHWLDRDTERRAERLDALRKREREAREAALRQERALERQRRETRDAERHQEQAREDRRKEQAQEARRTERAAVEARKARDEERAREARREERRKAQAQEARRAEREKEEARKAREEQEAQEAQEARREDRRKEQAREARREQRAAEEATEARQEAQQARQHQQAEPAAAAADDDKARARKQQARRAARKACEEAQGEDCRPKN